MAYSLEVRVPFLDHKVVEFCAAIPPSLKLRGLTEKYILRKAMQPLLPREIYHRKSVASARLSSNGCGKSSPSLPRSCCRRVRYGQRDISNPKSSRECLLSIGRVQKTTANCRSGSSPFNCGTTCSSRTIRERRQWNERSGLQGHCYPGKRLLVQRSSSGRTRLYAASDRFGRFR